MRRLLLFAFIFGTAAVSQQAHDGSFYQSVGTAKMEAPLWKIYGNHWITLELEGVETNRAASGTRISLTFKEQGGTRHVYRTVGYGSSFGGNPLRQHIGVGKADSIEKIEIFWPVSQTTLVFTDVAIDHAFHVKEGVSKLDPVSYKQFSFDTLPTAKNSIGMQH